MSDHARTRVSSTVRRSRPVLALAAVLVVLTAATAGADPLDPVAGPASVPDPRGLTADALQAADGATAPVLARAASGCAGAGARPAGASSVMLRAAVRCLVNRVRAQSGLRALRSNAALAAAAGRHAADMAHRRYFAHQRHGGPSLSGRARAAGWHGSAIGEGIAYGCGGSATPAATVHNWLVSPPHRAILLSGRYGLVGVGVARRAPVRCRGGATWVLDAGRG